MKSEIEHTINDITVNKKKDSLIFLPFRFEILVLIFLIFVCAMIGALVSRFFLTNDGQMVVSLLQELKIDQIKENIDAVRIIMFISNFGTFLLPGVIMSLLIYKRDWLTSVSANRFSNLSSYIVTGILMLSALPLVAYSFIINQKIPLPEWMIQMEEESNQLISALLQMNTPWELMLSIFIIAIIPAIGEEWIFRGILQDRLTKWFKNGHVAVWVAAILFSAIHGQFQGFLPRMLLGGILGYLFLWSGSLWLSIFGHFINNSIQVIGYYIVSKNNIEINISETPEIFWWQGLISLFVIVALLTLLQKMNQNTYSRLNL